MGEKWPARMNLPFFAVEAYVPGGGSRIRPREKSKNAFQPVPARNSPSPQNAENGDPKIQNRDGPGNSGKFGVSVEFPQKSLVRGRFREINQESLNGGSQMGA